MKNKNQKKERKCKNERIKFERVTIYLWRKGCVDIH